MREIAEKIANAVKDGWLWATDKIEKHPHWTLALWPLSVALVLWVRA